MVKINLKQGGIVTVQKEFSFKVYSSFWIDEARKAKVTDSVLSMVFYS